MATQDFEDEQEDTTIPPGSQNGTALQPMPASITDNARSLFEDVKTFSAGGQFGIQVDAGGSLVEGHAGQAQQLMTDTLRRLVDRKIPGVSLSKRPVAVQVGQSGQQRDHMIIKQQLSTGDEVNMALRIAPYGGKDLEVSWRLFERNSAREAKIKTGAGLLIGFGAIVGLAGLITVVMGIGACLAPIGLGMVVGGIAMWGSLRVKVTTSTYGQFDALALAATVNRCVGDALTAVGVNGKADIVDLKRQGVNLAQMMEQSFVAEATSGF